MNNMNFSNFMPNNPWNMNNVFNTSALTDNATKMYNSMSSNFTKNIEMLQDMFSNSITKDSFKNLNHNMEAYTRMYEIWLPVYKSLQNKMFDMESLKQMANPAQFKSVMDKVFNFNSAEHIQNFTNMLNGSVNYSQEHLQANMNEMMELNQKNMALLAKIMSGDFNAISEYNNNIIAYANKQQNPLAKLFPQMNENDYSQKMQSLVTDLNKYSSTISQLQYKMYVTGQNTLENLIKEVAELAQEGKDVSNYNEFYQKWIEVSEKAYIEFFKTDEFSALQGEVINLGLRLKLDIEAATEKMFEGLPIAKKSDLDELYKTIADLKRRLRTVEKNDSEVVSEETKSTKKAKA